MTNCETIMIGIDPATGATAQLIDVSCMPAPAGAPVHAAPDGSHYWCRPWPHADSDVACGCGHHLSAHAKTPMMPCGACTCDNFEPRYETLRTPAETPTQEVGDG